MLKTFVKVWSTIVQAVGNIHWNTDVRISDVKQNKIRGLLKDDYYIILTRRSNHLSTYFIAIIELFLTGKVGYWSHALMNLEDTVTEDKDFRLMEATGVGVHYAEFGNVFDAQSAVLMKPKHMTLGEWTDVLDDAKAQLGKPYDTLFNIADSSSLSCIELVRQILMGTPGYQEKFKNFEAMITRHKNLSPQMLYDCEDFEIVYEIRNH